MHVSRSSFIMKVLMKVLCFESRPLIVLHLALQVLLQSIKIKLPILVIVK